MVHESIHERFGCVTRHFLSGCLLCVIFSCTCWVNFRTKQDIQTTADQSGSNLCLDAIMFVRMMPLFWAVGNLAGILLMNPFPAKPRIQIEKYSIPRLCFRVVTRGLFPNLVRENIDRNMDLCRKVGLENFCFEVVTDIPINLKETFNLREIVVPSTYVTQNKTLYKARALHYCLEPNVNRLADDDWIVHLDEETTLTESSIIGLINASGLDKCDIGTGLITYSNLGVVNWVTTLSENIRVALDLGIMRLSFAKLGVPIYGMKGSFILVKGSVERDVGFDFGPRGSIVEDCMFALLAWKKGYRFNFVDGEMWEKSAFTLKDYIKQRARWYIGRYYVLSCRFIPFRYKFFLLFSFFSTTVIPIISISVIASQSTHHQTFWGFKLGLTIISTNTVCLFALGSIKSTSHKRGFLVRVLLFFISLIIIPITGILDSSATLYGMWTGRHLGFHVVEKEEHKMLNNNVKIINV